MSARPAEVPLPNWPALMDEPMASAYLGMSHVTFRAVAARYKVAPVDMGVRLLRWRRTDLDRMVDSLPARGVTSPPEAILVVDSFEDGLRRAARRGRR